MSSVVRESDFPRFDYALFFASRLFLRRWPRFDPELLDTFVCEGVDEKVIRFSDVVCVVRRVVERLRDCDCLEHHPRHLFAFVVPFDGACNFRSCGVVHLASFHRICVFARLSCAFGRVVESAHGFADGCAVGV